MAVQRPIAASSDIVWQAIAARGNLETCHPFCKKNPVTAWPGDQSRDEIHYLSGWVFERQFIQWTDGVGYDLETGRKGRRKSSVPWRIEPVDDNNSTLSISIRPHAISHIPVLFWWVPHLIYVKPLLEKYLLAVTGGFEYFIMGGKAVPRNYFGSHPWFSDVHD